MLIYSRQFHTRATLRGLLWYFRGGSIAKSVIQPDFDGLGDVQMFLIYFEIVSMRGKNKKTVYWSF